MTGTITPKQKSTDDPEGIDFLMAFARSLHTSGTPAHRMEAVLSIVADSLGIAAEFFATPTALFATFGPIPSDRILLGKFAPGNLNLERLRKLDKLGNEVSDGKLSAREGVEKLRRIDKERLRFGPWLTTASYAIVASSASLFFGGGVAEMFASFPIGLMIGLLALLAGRSENFARLYEASAAFVATFSAMVISAYLYPVAEDVCAMVAIIILIPGLTLTVSIRELASGHLVCGTARFASALVIFIFMGFGVAFGNKTGQFFIGELSSTAAIAQMPLWALLASLAAASACFGVLFQAHPKDFGWILISVLVSYWGVRIGSQQMGPELGAFAGALMVGLVSNIFARITHAPASITLVPGIIILLPGAMGFKSVSALLERNVVYGIETAFTALLIGMSLVAGLLVASALMPPKKVL